MQGKTARPATVDEYIAQFPDDVQQILSKIRAVVKDAAPEAQEKISYQMPGYILNGYLLGFAAHSHHIGFYPTPSGTEGLKEELAAYEQTKGSVHFPLDKPVPYDLIRRMVVFRVAANKSKKK